MIVITQKKKNSLRNQEQKFTLEAWEDAEKTWDDNGVLPAQAEKPDLRAVQEPLNVSLASVMPDGGRLQPGLNEITAVVQEALDRSGGTLELSDAAQVLYLKFPDFRPSSYGCSKLASLFTRKMSSNFVLTRDKNQNRTMISAAEKVESARAEPLHDDNADSFAAETHRSVEVEKKNEESSPSVTIRADILSSLTSVIGAAGARSVPQSEEVREICEQAFRHGWEIRSADGETAVINTGLVNRFCEPVYGYLEQSVPHDGQKWDMKAFCTAGTGFYGTLMNEKFCSLPGDPPFTLDDAIEGKMPQSEETPAICSPGAEKTVSAGADADEEKIAVKASTKDHDTCEQSVPEKPEQSFTKTGVNAEVRMPEVDESTPVAPESKPQGVPTVADGGDVCEAEEVISLPHLQRILLQLLDRSGGQIRLSALPQLLRQNVPGFRSSHYGCNRLVTLLTRKMNGVVRLVKDKRRGLTMVVKGVGASAALLKSSDIQPLCPDMALGGFSVIQARHCRALSEMALEEPWNYGSGDDGSFSVLREYLRAIYGRLRQAKKIGISRDGGAAAFNTGLLDHNYEPIYAYFEKNSFGSLTGWELKDFCLNGQGQYGKLLMRNFAQLPEAPDCDLEAGDLIYNLKLGTPVVDWTHVLIDKVQRLPLEVLRTSGLDVPDGEYLCDLSEVQAVQSRLRSDPNAYRRLKSLFIGALDLTMKQLQYDFTVAVPVYRTADQSTALALPLCLLRCDQVDLGLIVERTENGYIGHTVYPLDWVYNSARSLFKPGKSWLNPELMTPFPLIRDDVNVATARLEPLKVLDTPASSAQLSEEKTQKAPSSFVTLDQQTRRLSTEKEGQIQSPSAPGDLNGERLSEAAERVSLPADPGEENKTVIHAETAEPVEKKVFEQKTDEGKPVSDLLSDRGSKEAAIIVPAQENQLRQEIKTGAERTETAEPRAGTESKPRGRESLFRLFRKLFFF